MGGILISRADPYAVLERYPAAAHFPLMRSFSTVLREPVIKVALGDIS